MGTCVGKRVVNEDVLIFRLDHGAPLSTHVVEGAQDVDTALRRSHVEVHVDGNETSCATDTGRAVHNHGPSIEASRDLGATEDLKRGGTGLRYTVIRPARTAMMT